MTDIVRFTTKTVTVVEGVFIPPPGLFKQKVFHTSLVTTLLMKRRRVLAAASIVPAMLSSGCLFTYVGCMLQPGSVGFESSQTSASVGEEVVFRADANCVEAGAGGKPDRFKWSIGNGSEFSKTGKVISHKFQSPGSYPITVKYNQGLGAGPTDTQTITITEDQSEISIDNNKISINLQTDRTEIFIEQQALLSFSATNLIGNKNLTIQLIFDTPSGLQVTGAEFVDAGSGQYTSVFELEPGDNRGMNIHLQASEPGTYELTGHVIYEFEGEETDREIRTTTLPIVVTN